MREMKDSGVQVVGKVPANWLQKRLKYLCAIQTGNEDTQNASPDGEYPFYVRSPIIERCDRYTFDGEGILVAGDGAGAGRIFHHAFGKYAVHQRVYRLSKFKFNSQFIHTYLSTLFPIEMDKGSAQSTVPSMRLPMLLNFPVFLPHEREAKIITKFLDIKCTETERIIEALQHQIEILQKYKQSVITEAVTKGLNKNVEMKDSGISTLKSIPSNWELKKVKYIATSLSKGNGITKEDISIDGDIQCIRYGEIYTKYTGAFSQAITRTTLEKILSPKYIFSGDILFAGTGELIDEIGKNVVFVGNDPCLAGGDIVIMTHSQNPIFLNYALNSSYSQAQKSKGKAKLKVVHISTFDIGNIKIALPPLEEQNTIADYLDTKCAEIDALLADKQKQLDTLAEYKKSLIYEYVTGKKEVPVDE